MKNNRDLINEETIKKLVGKHITFLIYSLDNNDNPIFNRDYNTLTGKLVSYKNGKLYIDLEVIQDIETEDLKEKVNELNIGIILE